ncbi:MAG: DNA alkylation repair protein, partial [Acidimicrobiia bacterium]
MGYGGRVAALVSAELARRADPAKAVAMAAYMKTDMPFYGVQK